MFFTAGSNIFQFDIDFGDFERSLYYNLLLQPEGLAFSDQYFFSTYVLRHLNRYQNSDSWLEGALNEGTIVPFFREQEIRSFQQALSHLKHQGLLGLPGHADYIARRLDAIKCPDPHFWPNWNVGGSLERNLAKYLTANGIPFPTHLSHSDLSDFHGFWNRTEAFRVDDVLQAKANMSDRGEDGVRVSEIIKSTAERLVPNAPTPNNVVELLEYLKRIEISPQEIEDTRIFFKLVCGARPRPNPLSTRMGAGR